LEPLRGFVSSKVDNIDIAGRDRAIIAAYDDHLAPLHPDLHLAPLQTSHHAHPSHHLTPTNNVSTPLQPWLSPLRPETLGPRLPSGETTYRQAPGAPGGGRLPSGSGSARRAGRGTPRDHRLEPTQVRLCLAERIN